LLPEIMVFDWKNDMTIWITFEKWFLGIHKS
jgi:hypothetical protein